MSAPIIQTTDLESTFEALRNQNPMRMTEREIPYSPDYKSIPQQNLAPTGSTYTGSWGNGMAKFASGGVVYGQPQFFSPVHTPINWQIPSKRLEQYQWARFFYENEPKVASSIDFYSYFPMNDYDNECKDRQIRKYYDNFKKRLDIAKWTRLISHEVHLLGDCFPFIEISCPHCGGSGRIGDEICEHESGTVRRIVILNPDYVEVYTSPLNPDPVIALKPDEELINMVQKKTPGYEKLTPEVIKLISSGQPIRLDNRNVFHLKYGEGGYSKYGIGMVRRLFPVLSYKTKLMVAQWIVAERLIVPIKIVKVGSDERPAGPADIAAVQAQLAQTANDPNLTIVTHHAFELDWYGACYDSETEVLTVNGWKKYSEVSKAHDEKVATYNSLTGEVEYQIPTKYHEYNYNGELCVFKGKHYDMAVTPNHKMLASMRKWDSVSEKYTHSKWDEVRADNIIENSRFKCSAGWHGFIPDDLPYKSEYLLSDLELDDYLQFIGYYVSEGGLKIDKGIINAVSLSQKEDSSCFESMKNSIMKVSNTIQESEDTRSVPSCWQFYINDSKFAREIAENYGKSSINKKLPRWILNLPVRELVIILNSLMEGDGNVRFSSSGVPRYKYTTVSKELADSVQEIVFKLGYSPKINKVKLENKNHNDIYIISWCESLKDQKFVSVKDRNIGRKKYNGKVWCFTVPNGFFITRRNGKIAIQGNSGKVLTLSNEFEFINQEILDGMMINNALLNGEGPNFTHSEDTRLLTDNGLKYCDEFDIENDMVATFNPHTKELEYQKATQKFVYNWNSIDGDDPPLKHFNTKRIDMMVTPNHRMLCAERKLTTNPGEGGQKVNGQKEGFGEWKCVRAHSVKKRSKFRCCFDDWKSTVENKEEYCGIKTKDFLTIVGWYISEGYRNKWVCKDGSESIQRVSFSQSESANKEVYNKMCEITKRNKIFHMTDKCKNVFYIQKSDNKALVDYLASNCGEYANSKCIPKDIKNMSKENLKILLDALVEGDGNERPATKKKETDRKYYSYTTVSTQLRDDVIEILFKLGFSPRFAIIKFDSDKLQTQYTISWSDTENGKFPVLDSRKWNGYSKPQTKKEVINDVDYVGKVWCVEVPNHFIITERNGVFGVHCNSNAAVGIESMIERLETFRREMSTWIEESIYKPEALRQGFLQEDIETHEEELLYPTIKWNSMHLRDQQQHRTFMIQLYEKGLVSAQTVLETFNLDPDQEIERKRYDAVQMMALGQGMGQMGGAGGMGGDMGGGMGGMPPMGGDMGGGDMGGMGGDMGGGGAPIGAPGGDMGGGPAMASSTNKMTIADPSNYGGKVLKKKSRERFDHEQSKMYQQQQKTSGQQNQNGQETRDNKGRIIFTKPERQLMDQLVESQKNGLIKYPIVPQFEIAHVTGQNYLIDFAIPTLKIGIEADGEAFHSSPKQISHDKERDMKLSQTGWTILRFSDDEIEKIPEQVTRTIIQNIMRKEAVVENQPDEIKKS